VIGYLLHKSIKSAILKKPYIALFSLITDKEWIILKIYYLPDKTCLYKINYIIMLKALVKSAILFILLLFNMVLFIWCVNQLEWGKTPFKKTLISNVQAEASPHYRRVPVTPLGPINNKKMTHSTRRKPSHQVILQFRSKDIHLDKAEHVKFANMLQRLKISNFHQIKVFFGPAPFENNISSSQTAKLRAQMVARLIYPYTQTVKMSYRSSMEKGKVIVEIFEPPNSK
jgi:hypothetical protein